MNRFSLRKENTYLAIDLKYKITIKVDYNKMFAKIISDIPSKPELNNNLCCVYKSFQTIEKLSFFKLADNQLPP